MAAKFSLDGAMIPRTVRRSVNQRAEERLDAQSQTAVLVHRGRRHVVRLANISTSGAMVLFSGMPHIGDEIMLQLLDRGQVSGHVRWVGDGRIGVSFGQVAE